ncbi:hypothetical protein ACF07W_37575 [Streptomyces sp. NPDC015140]|uniref:hypothetical protein n=1 Tax=Streptomyces sp. NPDC015140 TaxID=3364943 RepID=UPI0036F6938F
MIAQAEHAGHRMVGGLMLDRVTTDDSLTGWDPQTGLDAAYPLGAFLTHQLLRREDSVLARPLVATVDREPWLADYF